MTPWITAALALIGPMLIAFYTGREAGRRDEARRARLEAEALGRELAERVNAHQAAGFFGAGPIGAIDRTKGFLSIEDVEAILSAAINGRGNASMEVWELIGVVNAGQAIDFEDRRIVIPITLRGGDHG